MTLVLNSRLNHSSRAGGFRHLVYFIDGTWLFAGSNKSLVEYSNIYIMNTILDSNDEAGHAQIAYYSRGLGATYGPRKYTSGGFSYGIDEQVQDLYINLCSNYEPNDRIYIFGFSRGAVVARALVDLLSLGILNPHSIYKLPDLWKMYSRSGLVSLPNSGSGGIILDSDYANNDPKVEFIGLYDTVSGGHGLTNAAQRINLYQKTVNPIVKNAVHIVALNESRSFFRPVMWANGHAKIDHFEQVWMPGVHSDIGGAYRDRSLGNAALITMIDRVLHRTKLSFNLSDLVHRYNFSMSKVAINNEYTKFWKATQLRAHKRILDKKVVGQTVHVFAKWLDGQSVQWKGKDDRKYELHQSFKDCQNMSPWFLTGHFDFRR